jgi:replication factor A1
MNTDLELAPHIEDLTWALGEDVDSNKIEVELKNCLEKFGLPLTEAKRCVAKKFGKDPKILGNVVDKTISELTGVENSVNLLCRIIFIDEKEVTVDGKPKRIMYGILGDTTGTVPFTAWHELNCDKGTVIRIYNAYIRSRNGKPQVNLGDRTHIRELPPDTLPKVKNNGNGEAQECAINEFRDGLSNVSSIVRILDLEERTITVKGEEKQIFRGIAADETGKCRFAAWSDLGLKPDDVIKFTDGYIKSWRGVPELQLNGGTAVEKLKDDTLPERDVLAVDKVRTVRQLKERGGAASTAVEGIILDVRPGSGLVERCPECNRVLQNYLCMVHGKVKGEYDLRVKCVLDDGTGALNVVLNKDITEEILEQDLESCIELAKDQMRTDIIYDQLIEKLLARPVHIQGVVVADEFGLMMIGSSAEVIVPKIKTESVSLLKELGVYLENELED